MIFFSDPFIPFFLFPPSPQTRRANRPCFQICSSSHNFLAISTKGNDSILASHWNDFILTGTAWSTFDAHPQSTDFRGNHLFGLNRCASLGCSVDTFFEYVNFICPSFINCNILLKYHWFFITLFLWLLYIFARHKYHMIKVVLNISIVSQIWLDICPINPVTIPTHLTLKA